jgi:hypothetical protein
MIVASLQRVASMMNAEHIDASPMLHVGIADEPAANTDGTVSNPVASA